IKGRKDKPVEGSYTNKLLAGGKEKILKKIGEEATEVVMASMRDDKGQVIYESADLIYHLLVALAEAGVEPGEVYKELKGRMK
ncbi:MAG TPA: phosphoribosyl-ATP diphosphatase, partial [Nitrospirota bacterium]